MEMSLRLKHKMVAVVACLVLHEQIILEWPSQGAWCPMSIKKVHDGRDL